MPHAITAKGWGRSENGHPDFLHFFFEAGDNSLIAFFYYIGTKPNPTFTALRGQYLGLARHTAWTARDVAELERWRTVIKRTGVKVTPVVRHETLSSIYFQDPNGYDLEIACQDRPLQEIDVVDTGLTIEAMIQTFGDDNPDEKTVYDMWHKKAELVRKYMQSTS
jgi:catechol 2,3-dioxygenase-like lactoylglutathione lyase family enzyme